MVASKKDIARLRKVYENKVKTELHTVYITSSGDKYIEEMDAYCAESKAQQAKKSKQKRGEVIMVVAEILIKILKENNWGVFYKSEPIQTLTIQDGSPLLKVNEVDVEALENSVISFLNNIQTKELTGWVKKEIEVTTSQLHTSSKQKND